MNKQEHEALRLCVEALDQLLPYLAKVPADVGLLNDALMAARPLLKQGPAPAQDEREIIGSERYRVVPAGGNFGVACVKAGDGERKLYQGHIRDCERVAAELATAFEDGKFVATRPAQTEQQPVAWAAKNTATGKFGYIWHEEDDVRGWIHLQHQASNSTWRGPIPLYAAPIAQTAPQSED